MSRTARWVAVIGAGPAGMAAAHAARRAGARVTLIDSSPRLGGQYWREAAAKGGPRSARSAAGSAAGQGGAQAAGQAAAKGGGQHARRGAQFARLAGLIDAAGVEVLTGVDVAVLERADGAIHLVLNANAGQTPGSCWRL
ncbi:MAG: NAD(P)-binding protein, partial [Bifidobacteriaceae bacterium]|nr:NAD(P)-binding protein [Bifidobacteriaceae bacterium]